MLHKAQSLQRVTMEQRELLFILVFHTFIIWQCSDCSRILLFPYPARSHAIWMSRLAEENILKDELFVILPLNNGIENEFTKLGVTVLKYGSNDTDTWQRHLELENKSNYLPEVVNKGKIAWMKFWISMMHLWAKEGENMLQDDIFIHKVRDLHFEMAVVNSNPVTKYYYVLLYKLDIPFVSISAGFDPRLNGIPAPWSFVPLQLYRVSDQMEFKMRLLQVSMMLLSKILNPIFTHPSEALVAKYCPEKEQIALDHIIRKSRLWIYDLHPVLDYPRPSLPHTIYMGALTIKNAQPLPDGELKTFIDGASHGVIVVAMGTYIKTLKEEYSIKFLEAFRRLKQRVIWRYVGKLPNISSNVLLVPWLPQNDVLGHSKTKLFITHCGNNGQHEAVYHGVPMIGFPMFVDQFYNAHRVVVHGFGLEINIQNFNSDELYNKMNTVLTDDTFSQKVKKATAILKDDGLPVEKASYWIRHVTKFGSDHLRSPAVDMPWYTYWCIDTVGFLVICCITIIFILVYLCKCCARACGRTIKEKAN